MFGVIRMPIQSKRTENHTQRQPLKGIFLKQHFIFNLFWRQKLFVVLPLWWFCCYICMCCRLINSRIEIYIRSLRHSTRSPKHNSLNEFWHFIDFISDIFVPNFNFNFSVTMIQQFLRFSYWDLKTIYHTHAERSRNPNC